MKFIISVQAKMAPGVVVAAIKQIDPTNIKIINVTATKKRSRKSGFILIECSEETAAKIKESNVPGIMDFEPETVPTEQQDELFHLTVRNFVNSAPSHRKILSESHISPKLTDIDKWMVGKDLPADMALRVRVMGFIYNHYCVCKCG